MPEQIPLAMKPGDIISDQCSSCGKSWVEHPGIQLLCAEAQQLKEEIVKLKQEMKDLMEGKNE